MSWIPQHIENILYPLIFTVKHFLFCWNCQNEKKKSIYIFFSIFPPLSPNLVPYLFQSPILLSIHHNGPVAQRPRRSRILESDIPSTSRIVSSFTRNHGSETCKQGPTVYSYPTPPTESSPYH